MFAEKLTRDGGRPGVFPMFLLLLTAALFLSSESTAAELDNGRISVSGFGDILLRESGGEEHVASIGQAEIDLEAVIDDSSRIVASLALAHDDGSMCVAVFMAAFTLYDRRSGNVSWFAPRKINLAVGRFDVPFGVDREYYASIDRPLITAPFAIEQTHNSWNSTGAFLTTEFSSIDITLFGVNGGECADHRYGDEEAWTRALAIGGRIGTRLVEQAQLGFSLAHWTVDEIDAAQTLAGVDLIVTAGRFAARGEVIHQAFYDHDINQWDRVGYYFQCTASFGRIMPVVRVGELLVSQGSRLGSEVTTGVSVNACENTFLRAEYRTNYKFETNESHMQLAFRFE